MNSLKIISFKKSIEDYVEEVDLPMEVKRLVFKEIYENIQRKALEEVMAELQEKEKENAD